MIPLNFYRDDEYVYYNNPNGITKKMTIADFEALMSGEGELPAYTSSNNGEVLSVDSEGDLDWVSLPPAELPAYSSSNDGEVLSVDSNGDLEWVSLPPSDSSVMIIGFKENGALDKNWEEIMTAMKTKAVLILEYDLDDETTTLVVQEAYIDETTNKYTVVGFMSTSSKVYNSDTSTGDLFVFEG